MILVDLSQVMISNLMAHLHSGGGRDFEINEDLLRHMILNKLRDVRVRFKDDGEMIICCDGGSWRRTVFPYYKARRRQAAEESKIDWNVVFQSLNSIREELKQFMHWRVVHVEGAEGDDVIGQLVHRFGSAVGGERLVIVSGDKDFKQLHGYGNVYQYDPIQKKRVVVADADQFLLEQIAKGDVGDGVPNCLSPDDTFVSGKRQAVMTQKRLAEVLKQREAHPTGGAGWIRNLELIDLARAPAEITAAIMANYDEQAGKTRKNLMDYFIKFRLRNLMTSIGDFT